MIVLDLKQRKPVPAPAGETVLCLGNFDGVHRGHRALIEQTLREKEALRARYPAIRSGAWCFAVSPKLFLSDNPPAQITSLWEKTELMAQSGLDYAILGDFSVLHAMTPTDFIRDVLQRECRCVSTVCGFNFRFGGGGVGTPEDLGHAFGADACRIAPVRVPLSAAERRVSGESEGESESESESDEDAIVSSSRIRTLLTAGETEEAALLLGHPFFLHAPVLHGKALGRTIGLPTVNQNFSRCHLIPASGIYATRVRVDGDDSGREYLGVTNVGVRPTVHDGRGINCETNLLDFEGSLYGKEITVSFYRRLRGEKKFENLEALQAAIRHDREEARAFFEHPKGGLV